MVVALKEVKIRGEIRTIVDYAIDMIQSPDFTQNRIHTGWLDSRIAAHVSSLFTYQGRLIHVCIHLADTH